MRNCRAVKGDSARRQPDRETQVSDQRELLERDSPYPFATCYPRNFSIEPVNTGSCSIQMSRGANGNFPCGHRKGFPRQLAESCESRITARYRPAFAIDAFVKKRRGFRVNNCAHRERSRRTRRDILRRPRGPRVAAGVKLIVRFVCREPRSQSYTADTMLPLSRN